MSFTINAYTIAECQIQGVNIHPVLGAYEMNISLWFNLMQASEIKEKQGVILVSSARISAKKEQEQRILGSAWPDAPIRLEPKMGFSTATSACLQILLSPHQLFALEDFRKEGDFDFSVYLYGESSSLNGYYSSQKELSYHMPSSAWIKMLKTAGVSNSILFEVPLPLTDLTDEWKHISHLLNQAQKHFEQGDYRAVVSNCRDISEEVCNLRYENQKWNFQLAKLSDKDTREGMSKDEREMAVWAAIQNYAHLAHHSTSKGGEGHYTRSEARQILDLTASLIARYQSRES